MFHPLSIFIEYSRIRLHNSCSTSNSILLHNRQICLYLSTEHMHNKFNKYAAWFYICEQLNLVVVILAWLITDKFLKHQFLFYAPTVFAFLQVTMMMDTLPPVSYCLVQQSKARFSLKIWWKYYHEQRTLKVVLYWWIGRFLCVWAILLPWSVNFLALRTIFTTNHKSDKKKHCYDNWLRFVAVRQRAVNTLLVSLH